LILDLFRESIDSKLFPTGEKARWKSDQSICAEGSSGPKMRREPEGGGAGLPLKRGLAQTSGAALPGLLAEYQTLKTNVGNG